MIQAVDKNKIAYTKTQMERAKVAKKIVSYCVFTYIGCNQSHAQEQHYDKLSCYYS